MFEDGGGVLTAENRKRLIRTRTMLDIRGKDLLVLGEEPTPDFL